MRQKEVRPIIEEFYSFIETLRSGKGSHLGTAVTYAQNQKDKLLLFLEHYEVEVTNNLAEHTVKPFVIDRKNFLFSATDKGADARNSQAKRSECFWLLHISDAGSSFMGQKALRSTS